MVDSLKKEIKQKDEEIDAVIKQKDEEIKRKDEWIKRKDKIIQDKQKTIDDLRDIVLLPALDASSPVRPSNRDEDEFPEHGASSAGTESTPSAGSTAALQAEADQANFDTFCSSFEVAFNVAMPAAALVWTLAKEVSKSNGMLEARDVVKQLMFGGDDSKDTSTVSLHQPGAPIGDSIRTFWDRCKDVNNLSLNSSTRATIGAPSDSSSGCSTGKAKEETTKVGELTQYFESLTKK